MPDRILIIEDEKKIARVLELELRHEGYEAEWIDNGNDAVEAAVQKDWSCILLDLQLPGKSGLEVLEEIRNKDSAVPVLIMTARDSVADKVEGLDRGANDYVTKPFAFEELSARIRAVIRTSKLGRDPKEGEVLRVDALSADTRNLTVTREDQTIELTPREYELLVFLLQHKGEVLSRERILSEVWGFDFAGETNLVDVYIRYLRQKIDRGYKKKLIHTKRGVGYSIQEPEL